MSAMTGLHDLFPSWPPAPGGLFWIGLALVGAALCGEFARAALKLPEFTPPLIGYAKMANFKVLSMPGTGTLLLTLAWLLGPIAVWMEWRDRRRAAQP